MGDRTTEIPIVSVVIPAYNAHTFIGKTLRSVFSQTYSQFELILVNDGSPDTVDLEREIEAYQNRVFYIYQENRGPSAARNAGIRVARGKYIALLDSDDLWLEDYLRHQVEFIEQNPAIDLVCADAYLFGEGAGRLSTRTFLDSTHSKEPITFERLLRWDCSILTSGVVVRKSALMRAGLFDERFIRSEDFHLWLRLVHSGSRMAYNKRVLVKHRMHASSLAASYPKMVESQIEVCEKICEELPLSTEQQSLIWLQISNANAHLALHKAKEQFLTGNYDAARDLLAEANDTFGSKKLTAARLALKAAPRTVSLLYGVREKLLRGDK